MSFDRQLGIGKVGESLIARFMMRRGNAVLPVYEVEKGHGKGPQFFLAEQSLVAPDMLVFTASGQLFIEAKHKSVFTWYRKNQCWTTGIDLRHYLDYLRVGRASRIPVWLMFYHRESRPSDADLRMGCPRICPSGLYGGEIASLSARESHRTTSLHSAVGIKGHGRSGMVYWAERSLRKIAEKAEIESEMEAA